jgi:hypothetical protein
MNTTTIRPNIFARSCNDDYSPMMEDLCVKMRLLSLDADPKMEAYDTELDRSFYEEKVDLSRDEKNQETFVNNDETDYEAEVREFNEIYGVKFTVGQLNIFEDYIEENGLAIEDGIDYIQSCHNCGGQLKHFGNEYCSKKCCEYIEDYHYECFRGTDCLICHGYPQSTCYWAQNGCDRCDAYDGPESDRYPYYCFYCLTQMTDHEGYDIDDELYCNNCAVDLFDKTGHLEQDSKKRPREPEEEYEEKSNDQMRDLTDESCDIWELALDITQSVTAALQMIEDQERLRAHPRVIEYYRAKEASNEMDCVEECSSECSSLDEDLQDRKRARHIRFESVDESVAEEEAVEPMVIDLLSQDDYDVEDCDAEDYDYDYAESVDDYDKDEDAPNSVTMAQATVSSMVAMIQELRDENASLRDELELLRSQRRMLFPEGSSMSITDEDGERYINVHNQAQVLRGNHSPMTLSELDCDDYECISRDETFKMEEDE